MSLTFSDIESDYFIATLQSSHLNAVRRIYAYKDGYTFVDLFDHLAQQEKPWRNLETWSSLEGEFKFEARCSSLGQVTFKVFLIDNGAPEDWAVDTEICCDFGQLKNLAKSARDFFGASPD